MLSLSQKLDAAAALLYITILDISTSLLRVKRSSRVSASDVPGRRITASVLTSLAHITGSRCEQRCHLIKSLLHISY